MATYFRHDGYVYYDEHNVLQSSVTRDSEKSYETLTINNKTVSIIQNGTVPLTLFRLDGNTDYFYDWEYTKPKSDFVDVGCTITEIGQYPYIIRGDFVFKKDDHYYLWQIRMGTKIDASINLRDVTSQLTDSVKAQVDNSNTFLHFEQVTPRILIKLGSTYNALNNFNSSDVVELDSAIKRDFFNSSTFSTVYKTENEVYSTFPYDTDAPEPPVHFEPITLGDNEYFKYNNNYYSADNIQKHPIGNISSTTQLSLHVAKNFANIPAFCYQEDNNYYWFDDLGVDQTCFVSDYVNKTLVKTMPATIFGDKLYYKEGNDWYYQAINAAAASVSGTLETNASNIEAAEQGSSTNFTTLSLYNVSALDTIYLLDDLSDKVYIADSLGHPVSYVCNNGVLFDLFYPMYKVAFADAAPSVSDGKMYVKSNDVLTEASSYIIKTYSTLNAANADIQNIDDGQAVIVKTDPNYQGNFGLYVNNNGTLNKVFQGGGSSLDIAYAVGDIKCFYDGSTIPEGWLPCDGSTFVQADYPLLYSFLGTNVLPDFAGRCIRGASATTNVYASNTGRSTSNAATYEHKHPVTANASHTHNITSSAAASHNHHIVKTGLGYSASAGSITPAQRAAYGQGTAVASGGTVVTSSGPYIATVSVTGDLANNDVNSNETFINSANVLMYIKGTM